MIRAGVGRSQKQATGQAVEEAARGALAHAGISRADFAMIFFTADHAGQKRELVTSLIRAIGTDCVVGSSAAGVVTGDSEIEGSHGVAVLVLASDEISARPFIFEPLKENETNLGTSFGEFLAKTQEENSLMVLLPDTYNGNPQRLLESMASKAGFHPVVGAGQEISSGQAPALRHLVRRAKQHQNILLIFLDDEDGLIIRIPAGEPEL